MRFFTWRERLGLPECPYLERWVLNFGLFSIRVHHWISSDDQRHYHNHPWWFITLVLRGSYVDITEDSRDPKFANFEILSAGHLRYRPANHKHKVQLYAGESAWTFLITGSKTQNWGFFVHGKFKKFNKYFFENGHHPCTDTDDPVRTPTPNKL